MKKVSPPIHIPFILPGVLVGAVHSGQIIYINSLRLSVRPSDRAFCVLIRRQNRPRQSDGRTARFSMGEPAPTVGRTDSQIFYGRTGPDRRPLCNFDQRSLVSLSVSGQSVCDGGYQG
jgi:hypothetical protein